MSAFFIVPEKQEALTEGMKRVFEERGFHAPVQVPYSQGNAYVYPRLNGTSNHYKAPSGDWLLATGTLFYKNRVFPECGEDLLDALKQQPDLTRHLSGTFCLVWINTAGEVALYHDSHGVHRFYIEQESGIISSSFLSLVKLRERAVSGIDKQAVFENLLLGFNLGIKTWVTGIERVRHAEQFSGKEITYKRSSVSVDASAPPNRDLAVAESAQALQDTLAQKTESVSETILLGLSSGFDSRLTLAAFPPEKLEQIHFFTFHKPGDRDPVIASEIARISNKPLRKIETAPVASEAEREEVFRRAFLFFDGQCAVMMRYSKPDYTREFRDQLFDAGEWHISGVGGELFRNQNYDHRLSLNLRFWLDQYYSGGFLRDWLRDENLLHPTIQEIRKRLGLEKNTLDFLDRKRFYANVFLSDWHGVRNTIENQYAVYYSPFTDPVVIEQSLATAHYQGKAGEYEAAMIRTLSGELANINSEYGHTMMHIPAKVKWRATLRAWAKTPMFAFGRRLMKRKGQSSQVSGDAFPTLTHVLGSHVDVQRFATLKREMAETADYALQNILDS